MMMSIVHLLKLYIYDIYIIALVIKDVNKKVKMMTSKRGNDILIGANLKY